MLQKARSQIRLISIDFFSVNSRLNDLAQSESSMALSLFSPYELCSVYYVGMSKILNRSLHLTLLVCLLDSQLSALT